MPALGIAGATAPLHTPPSWPRQDIIQRDARGVNSGMGKIYPNLLSHLFIDSTRINPLKIEVAVKPRTGELPESIRSRDSVQIPRWKGVKKYLKKE